MGTGSNKQRRWTKIQTDRVLLGILARGLLSFTETRIALWIMARSWGEGSKDEPRPRTKPGVLSSWIANDIDMDGGQVRRCLNVLISDNIVIRGSDGSLEFNEHSDAWTRDKSSHRGRDESSRLSRDKSSHSTRDKSSQPGCDKSSQDKSSRVRRIVTEGVTNRHGKCDESSQIYNDPSDTTDTPVKEKRSDARKKRAPTAAENTFMDGFKKRHGHEPEIDKGHAIKLAQLVGKHGTEIVIAKINAWWTSGAGAWADARGTNRDIAAFLTSFDRIAIGGPNGKGSEIDTSRFDAATVES